MDEFTHTYTHAHTHTRAHAHTEVWPLLMDEFTHIHTHPYKHIHKRRVPVFTSIVTSIRGVHKALEAIRELINIQRSVSVLVSESEEAVGFITVEVEAQLLYACLSRFRSITKPGHGRGAARVQPR